MEEIFTLDTKNVCFIFYFSALLFFNEVFSANTFLTIFCSSIKNALTILCLTHPAHRFPPYALEMLLSFPLAVLNALRLMCLIPGKRVLQPVLAQATPLRALVMK